MVAFKTELHSYDICHKRRITPIEKGIFMSCAQPASDIAESAFECKQATRKVPVYFRFGGLRLWARVSHIVK